MIIDTFMFYNEFDLLEGRLEYLNPVVDKFIITESNITFSGNDKPYRFIDSIERYKKYLNKIIYIPLFFDKSQYDFTKKAEEQDFTHDAWKIEGLSRDAALDVIKCFSSDSLLLINDLDEIPKRGSIELAKTNYVEGEMISMIMPMYVYNLSCSNPLGWRGTTVVSVETALKWGSLNTLRLSRGTAQKYIYDGGWHLSYWGDYKDIVYKYKSFSHTELNRDDMLTEDQIRKNIQDSMNNPEINDPDLIEYFGKYQRKLF
jgi:beta-1,4-mannosyl-glycoprotein beta-1,4-N-acetylglucosaminyltransferase